MKKDKLTFIQKARREQIIQASVARIANNGFSNTSLADIAKDTDVSKNVIFYHFKDKNSLIGEITSFLNKEMSDNILEQVRACETATEKLHTYIKSSFDFISSNRNSFIAIFDIGMNFKNNELFSQTSYGDCIKRLENILMLGQKSGEFNMYLKANTLACIIQGSIDGIGIQWILNKGKTDYKECCKSLLFMLDRLVINDKIHPVPYSNNLDQHLWSNKSTT